jgi:hypothetical protein
MIVKEGVKKPGFQDVLAIVELKEPDASIQLAAHQVAAYFNEISGRGKCNFAHLAHSSLVAIGSNYGTVCIFGFSKLDSTPILRLYTTQKSELFPIGWKDLTTPTIGFSDLCNAIYQTGDSTSKYLTINGSDVTVTGTICEEEGVGVYFCTYRNEDIVVKQGYGKRGKGLVELELEKLKEVSKIQTFSPYLLPWKPVFQIPYGFAMLCARVISDECFQEEVFLEKQYRWLIEGLRILHSNRLFHMDIRPGNIVIYEDTARFIDWITLQRDELVHAWLRQGHDDPFWPVNRDKFDEKSMFYLWDVISLGYTFFFLAVFDRSLRSSICIDRLSVVNQKLTDLTLIGKLARIIQCLETSTAADKDNIYDLCLNMLDESI